MVNKDIIIIAAGALAFLALQQKGEGGGALSESGGLGGILGGLPTITPSGGGGADSTYIGIDAPNPVMEPIIEPTPEPTPTKKELAVIELTSTEPTTTEPTIETIIKPIVSDIAFYGALGFAGKGGERILEKQVSREALEEGEELFTKKSLTSSGKKIIGYGGKFLGKMLTPTMILDMLTMESGEPLIKNTASGEFSEAELDEYARTGSISEATVQRVHQGYTKKETINKSPTPNIPSYGGGVFTSGYSSSGYVSIEHAFRDVPVGQRSQKIIDAMNAQNTRNAPTKKEYSSFKSSM